MTETEIQAWNNAEGEATLYRVKTKEDPKTEAKLKYMMENTCPDTNLVAVAENINDEVSGDRSMDSAPDLYRVIVMEDHRDD